MTLGPNDLISLDTNVLVHWIRQNATGIHLRDTYHLEQRSDRPLFSSVVEGELRGLARCWNWGEAKLESLENILSELVRIDAGAPEVVRAYAEFYEKDITGGNNTGENDLWIAATAKAAGAVLLTCDSDCVWMN
jgi:tRNA(fMet)-specific endonuclease VapC